MKTKVTLNCQVKPDGHEALLPFLEKNLPMLEVLMAA